MSFLKLLPILLVAFYSFSSNAAFQLNRTRIIYSGDSGHQVFVKNHAPTLYCGQVWIENSDLSVSKNFVAYPQIFRIESEQKQTVRLLKTDLLLAEDRETLFFLNVQEVPPKSDTNSSGIVMSFRNRIKLIYRPDLLNEERYESERKMTWLQQGNTLTLKNPTPYYFAITGLLADGDVLESWEKKPVAPFSEVTLQVKSSAINTITLFAIDDFGAANEYEISKH